MNKNVLLLALLLFLTSCSGNSDGDSTIPPGTGAGIDTPPNTATTSCNFNLTSISAGETITLDCILNLQGQSASLPANVTLAFDKGDIINGSLDFSNQGKVDGRLLNSSVAINGEVTLISPNFKFYASRWGVIEGKASKEVTLDNRKNINKAIEAVKRLEGTVFELGKIDAYFNIEANKVNRQYISDRSIRIPSNFHFKMNDDTFLRVQPTHFPAYSLLTTYLTDNTLISGGNLIGDRWEHDYTPIIDISGTQRDEHGWGHLIFIIGSHGTIIDGTTTSYAIGEGIHVHAETIRNPDGTLRPGTRTSENVLITNCTVSENRRNGIAIVDANGVTIDNCDILATGQGEQAFNSNGKRIFSSSGAAPKYGIDLEATRYRNDDGTLNEINKVENVFIRNSNFLANEAGDIDIYTASDVLIEKNFFDKWVASFASHDVVIQNNTFEARDPEISFGISVNSLVRNGEESNYNYTIIGNTITSYRDGIKLSGVNQTMANNKIYNCGVGLQMGNLSDSEIYENEYKSNLAVSYGINPFPNSLIDNVTITNEYVEVTNRPLNFRGINSLSTLTTNQITIADGEFYTSSNNFKLYFIDSKNITIKNSIMNTNIEKINSTNIIEEGNTLISN